MTIAPAPASSLADLRAGDAVVLKRRLDHPAWARDGGVEEVISATTSVMDRREVPAVAGGRQFGGRDAKTLVRLPNGFWYDCATGLQESSGATVIERPSRRPRAAEG